MKFTRYFAAMKIRPDRAEMEREWIERVIAHPVKEIIQADGQALNAATVGDVMPTVNCGAVAPTSARQSPDNGSR